MNKFITIVKTIYKIWEYKITKAEINAIVNKEFEKLNKDDNEYLNLKDLFIAIYEHYKNKK